MDILQSIILGVVEGLTEFLPISSTFHLIFAATILRIPQTDFVKLFEIVIQAGAILSVLLLYLKTFTKDMYLLKRVIAAFIPTALVGFLMYKVIKNVFFASPLVMIGIFMLVGVIFIAYEMFIQKKQDYLHKSLSEFTYKEAILIGFIQALAVMPGVSRAGAVIVGMMLLRFKRDEAARFSFLLSVPTIFAASGYDLLKMRHVLLSSQGNMLLLLVGFVSAFISSYFVVKWFIQYLQKHSLAIFGWYRIILGLILLIFRV